MQSQTLHTLDMHMIALMHMVKMAKKVAVIWKTLQTKTHFQSWNLGLYYFLCFHIVKNYLC